MDKPIEVIRGGEPCEFARQVAALSEPQLRIEFKELPSWNDFLGASRHFGAAQGFMKKWRKVGAEAALRAAQRAGAATITSAEYVTSGTGRTRRVETTELAEVFFAVPVRVTVRVWRSSWRTYDISNIALKPLLDGFVDAKLLHDDNMEWLRSVEFVFHGVDKSLQLSAEAEAARKRARAQDKKRFLTPSRYWLDFHYL